MGPLSLRVGLLFMSVMGSVSAANTAIPFTPGFDIDKVAALAESLPSKSWEYGTAAEALLELYNPELSVFGANPFPVAAQTTSSVKALAFAAKKIIIGSTGLSNGDGSTGDPASLGVSAVMLGKTDKKFADAAAVQVAYLVDSAPRFSNGAISHRANKAVLWADFMYMAPPSLAFFAADKGDMDLLRDTYKQCGLYRDILQSKGQGLWKHIVGPEAADAGHWSTGNAWAAGGMARVLATIMRAPAAQDAPWRDQAINDLSTWIKEILDAVMGSSLDNGLVRNYVDDTNEDHGFGEIAGSALLAGVAYRMAALQPATFGASYITWADAIRKQLGSGGHVKDSGVVSPAVNPYGWWFTQKYTTGSPEGQAMVVLMYAAWRDCVNGGTCQQQTAPTTQFKQSSLQPSETKIPNTRCKGGSASRAARRAQHARRTHLEAQRRHHIRQMKDTL
ncbi:unsaturated rhamnogalacturonyl hydrolase YesR [Favolaschia claudopus]|uniref:Unsaturated rhamnogalacturonyl hydrolase YesR n=1 Tax=Favolaschia claudopus TaxID=2862362 RepID=A0AAW0BYG3_9AGAR